MVPSKLFTKLSIVLEVSTFISRFFYLPFEKVLLRGPIKQSGRFIPYCSGTWSPIKTHWNNILLGLDSSILNIPYWDFKYKHNLQGLRKCEYKQYLLGLRRCEYKHYLLGHPKFSKKNTPWWEWCTHLDRKILFQSLECAKDKKYHLPVPKWDFFKRGIKMIGI